MELSAKTCKLYKLIYLSHQTVIRDTETIQICFSLTFIYNSLLLKFLLYKPLQKTLSGNENFLPFSRVSASRGQRVCADCGASGAPWRRFPPDLWDPGAPAHAGPSAETALKGVQTSPLRPPSVAHSPTPASPEPTSASGSSCGTFHT